MRIWDIPPEKLCRQHLLGEHGELHSLWSILINQKKGFSKHPETLRWKGKLKALYRRHQLLVKELEKRGYYHQSPLDRNLATGEKKQESYLDSPQKQIRILKEKNCSCFH